MTLSLNPSVDQSLEGVFGCGLNPFLLFLFNRLVALDLLSLVADFIRLNFNLKVVLTFQRDNVGWFGGDLVLFYVTAWSVG